MRVAVVVSAKSFEAQIVGEPMRVAAFENTLRGIDRFQTWVLQAYRRGADIDVHVWEAEVGVGCSPFASRASAGKIMFRSILPWRSATGLVSVNHVGHSSAVELCRRFGYEGVTLEAVSRRA